MFVTAHSNRIHSPVMPKDEYLWSMVELELLIPILVISLHEVEGEAGSELTRTFFVQPHQLQQIASSPGIEIDRIDLFSPAHVNGSDGWKLEAVEAIWRCREPEHEGHTAWLFRVAGQEYCDSCLNTEPGLLKPEFCVYTQR